MLLTTSSVATNLIVLELLLQENKYLNYQKPGNGNLLFRT